MKYLSFVVIFLAFACNSKPKQEKTNANTIKTDSVQKDTVKVETKKEVVSTPSVDYDAKAIADVKAEPKVIEAIKNSTTLYVSVEDDGTNRNGYADYLCMTVKGSSISQVKVVKAGSTNDPNRDNAYGVLLGKSQCK